MALKIILCVIALIIILTVIISACLFHFVFAKPKRSTVVPEHYKKSLHYKVSHKGTEILKSIECEDVYITSRDGLKLHAYYYPAENPSDKFILGIHGFKSYSRPEFGPFVEYYRGKNYNILLPDDRAHAPSEGKYIGFGVLDRLDCVDWAKYIVNRFGEKAEILLHGVSMGAATVLTASGESDLPSQVKGICADCGYTRAWEVLSYQLKEAVHLPVFPFLNICELLCSCFAKYDFKSVSAIDAVAKSKTPILIVQGEDDKMVPSYMAKELYEKCNSPKKLLMVKGAGHAESIAIAPEEYHNAIEELFGI